MASHPSKWASGGEKEDVPYGTKEKTAGKQKNSFSADGKKLTASSKNATGYPQKQCGEVGEPGSAVP